MPAGASGIVGAQTCFTMDAEEVEPQSKCEDSQVIGCQTPAATPTRTATPTWTPTPTATPGTGLWLPLVLR